MAALLLTGTKAQLQCSAGISMASAGKLSRQSPPLKSIPGILLTLSVELAPPVRAGLQAQLKQQAVVIGVLTCVDVVLLQHSLICLQELQQCQL